MSQVAKITPVEHLPLASTPAENPVMSMIRQAVAAGQSIDVIRELKNMAKELADDEARRAFDTALAQAKGEIPVIHKNKAVGFASKKSGSSSTSYRHEDLGEIVRTVDPILKEHGLAYRFVPDQSGGPIKVTCVLSHVGGHSERFTLAAGADNTGNKNSIQAVGSTLTYLQRYTLKMALGLAASADDDGAASEEVADNRISPAQAELIRDLIEKTDSDIALFCTTFKVDALPDLRPVDFEPAMRSLNIKLARQTGASK